MLVILSFATVVGCARSAGTSPSSSSSTEASPPQLLPASANRSAEPSLPALAPAPTNADIGRANACTANIVSPLHVQVKDAVTGASICDASVVASHGADLTRLSCWGPPDCDYSWGNEQLGKFQVTVTKPRFRPATLTIVVNKTNGCHVVPRYATVRLEPLGSTHHLQ
jgi:hypothetical protein